MKLAVALLVVALGCGDDGSDESPDADVGDARTAEAGADSGDGARDRDASDDPEDAMSHDAAVDADPPDAEPDAESPDGDAPDADVPDATPDAESPDADLPDATPDAAATGTPCGPSLTCATATEVCVEYGGGWVGPTYDCVTVPSECSTDRSCDCLEPTVCPSSAETCDDKFNPYNFLECICIAC